jgi:hypothetical protein
MGLAALSLSGRGAGSLLSIPGPAVGTIVDSGVFSADNKSATLASKKYGLNSRGPKISKPSLLEPDCDKLDKG